MPLLLGGVRFLLEFFRVIAKIIWSLPRSLCGAFLWWQCVVGLWLRLRVSTDHCWYVNV